MYQAVCLEELTARELLWRLLDKTRSGLTLEQVSSFVRLTSTGVLVLVDDAVVRSLQEEANFLLQTIKRKLVYTDRCSLSVTGHRLVRSVSSTNMPPKPVCVLLSLLQCTSPTVHVDLV